MNETFVYKCACGLALFFVQFFVLLIYYCNLIKGNNTAPAVTPAEHQIKDSFRSTCTGLELDLLQAWGSVSETSCVKFRHQHDFFLLYHIVLIVAHADLYTLKSKQEREYCLDYANILADFLGISLHNNTRVNSKMKIQYLV